MRNTHEENTVSGADHERPLVAEGVGEARARREIVWLEGNLPRWWKQRVRLQSLRGEGLQIPTNSEIQRQVIGDADGVLREGGIFVGIGVRCGASKVLQIIVGDFVGVGAQGCELHPGLEGHEGEGIDFDRIEKIFTALLAGKEIVDPGKQSVSAKLQRVS